VLRVALLGGHLARGVPGSVAVGGPSEGGWPQEDPASSLSRLGREKGVFFGPAGGGGHSPGTAVMPEP